VRIGMYNMGNEYETGTCSLCGYNHRHLDLRKPCKSCGARKTLFGLYLKKYQRVSVYISIALVVLAIVFVVYIFLDKYFEINQLKQIIEGNAFLLKNLINLIG